VLAWVKWTARFPQATSERKSAVCNYLPHHFTFSKVTRLIVDTNVTARVQASLRPRLRLSTGSSERNSVRERQKVLRIAQTEVVGHDQTTINDLLASSFAALDLLTIGLAVCNISGQLLIANQTAQRILENRDGLQLDSDDVLCTTHDCSPSLSQLIQRAVRSGLLGQGKDSDAMLSVPRAHGQRALTILVRAVRGAAESECHANQPTALVLIVDSGCPAEAAIPELRRLYTLTSTEARLANLLMEGKTLAECGSQLGIRRSTVRMHLRNLFAKTGVCRQSELVALLLKSIGLGPRVSEGEVRTAIIPHGLSQKTADV
jgi:DNA-binding CsgD family transcriptional regulator